MTADLWFAKFNNWKNPSMLHFKKSKNCKGWKRAFRSSSPTINPPPPWPPFSVALRCHIHIFEAYLPTATNQGIECLEWPLGRSARRLHRAGMTLPPWVLQIQMAFSPGFSHLRFLLTQLCRLLELKNKARKAFSSSQPWRRATDSTCLVGFCCESKHIPKIQVTDEPIVNN